MTHPSDWEKWCWTYVYNGRLGFVNKLYWIVWIIQRQSLFILCKFDNSYSKSRFRNSMLRFLFLYFFIIFLGGEDEVEKNNFIALPGKGDHRRLMPSKLYVPTRGGLCMLRIFKIVSCPFLGLHYSHLSVLISDISSEMKS